MAKKKPKAAMDEKKQPVIEPAVELENADMPDSGEVSPLEPVTEEAEAELGEQADFEGGTIEENGDAAPLEPAIEQASIEAEAEFSEYADFENEATGENNEVAPLLESAVEEASIEAEEAEAELSEQVDYEGEAIQESDEARPLEFVAEETAVADAVLESEVFQKNDNILPFEPVVGKGALEAEAELESVVIEEHGHAPDAPTQEERDRSFIQKMREKYATPNPQKDKEEEEEKEASPDDGLTLKERKQKLEKELREKYGIPKSDKPVAPWVAPEVEQVVRIPHEQLHSFKDHPFMVEKNSKFMAFVASIRAQGVTQPAVVRPDGKDGYEIISGHRRDLGSIEAEIPYTPCIIRALNDDQAIQQMVEDNVNNREISTMELARALKMQLDALKHQGARTALQKKDYASDIDKRSNEVVAERNGMSVKQVQRHIALTDLIPSLQCMMDGVTLNGGKTIRLAFTPAVEISYISPKNQEYIALAVEGQQVTPSLSQAQRLRELDKKGILNSDMIDGILLEEKKEVDKVIISSQELSQFFGKDKTPREMKEQIMALLDEWKQKQPELSMPEKKQAQEL